MADRHTPEPWHLEQPSDTLIVTREGHPLKGDPLALLADGHGRLRPGEVEANARRIVACVNALSGLSTEAIVAGAVANMVTALRALEAVVGQMDRHFGAAAKLLMSAVTGKPVATAEVLASGDAIGALGDHIEAARKAGRAALRPFMEVGDP